MASAIYILDLKGKILISRDYRGDVPATVIEHFVPLLRKTEEENGTVPPILYLEDKNVHFIFSKYENVYILAITRNNINVATILVFIKSLVQVLVEYFNNLEEESIRDNFVLIYELLDEMMDFGYPQTTEYKVLKEYITQRGFILERSTPKPPIAVTNAVSWRTEGVFYRKNEIFLDVIELVNLLVNNKGNVVQCEVFGSIKSKCYLSGMPELKLGLNDKIMFELTGKNTKLKSVELEDVRFHQCVRLAKFESNRTISFIPPDGEFELMSYRMNVSAKPLVWVEASIENYSSSRINYLVKVKAMFKRRSTASNVEIVVPVMEDADSPKFDTETGTGVYKPEINSFVWKIKTLQGGKDAELKAQFGFPSIKDADQINKKAPINVTFELPYYTVSGIQVRYLKVVEKSGYQAMPWVRYITKNGDYQFRMPEYRPKMLEY